MQQASQLLLISRNSLQSVGIGHDSDDAGDFDNRIITVFDRDLSARLGWKDVSSDYLIYSKNISSDNCYQLQVDDLASMVLDPAKRSDIILTARVTFASQPDRPDTCIDVESQQHVIGKILPKILEQYFNTDQIEEFLLSYPNIINEDSKAATEKQFLTSLGPMFNALSEQKSIKQWGVCDFNSRQLETLMTDVKVKPDFNQVFYKYHNCCNQPHHDLLKFCKATGIKLLTHGDTPSKYVPAAVAIRALMRKHGLLLDRSSDPLGGVSIPKNQTNIQENDDSTLQVNRSIDTRWIAEITTRSKSRDVALSKHFILHVST